MSAELLSQNLCERIAATSAGRFRAGPADVRRAFARPYDWCRLNGRQQGDRVSVGVSVLTATAKDLQTARRVFEGATGRHAWDSEIVSAGDGAWGVQWASPAFVVVLSHDRLIRIEHGGMFHPFDDLSELARKAADLSATLPRTKPLTVLPQCEAATATVRRILGATVVVRRDQVADSRPVTCAWSTGSATVATAGGGADSDEARAFERDQQLVGTAQLPKVERVTIDNLELMYQPAAGLVTMLTPGGVYVRITAEPRLYRFSRDDFVAIARAVAPVYGR